MTTTIGFIGTGVMGKSMATHLIEAGYEVHLFTRTKAKAQELLDAGAVWEESIASLAQRVNVIISIVGYPYDVETIYLGEDGIITHAQPGTYLIDMTTSDPVLAETISQAAEKKDLHSLDAPVSGGDIGAKNGKLTIMAGGKEKDFEAMRPIFEKLGENIVLQGPAGAGQHTKMANQITIASNMIGVSEAIMYAKKAGLDPVRVLKSISTGAAGSWSLSNLAPRMIKGDSDPGFYIKHFIKDMKIALANAKKMGLQTPGLALSLELYEELAEKGLEDRGTQALIKWFEGNL
ncbi:NAD(P)-dependent oxidoreductase [Gracilibacillus thailandensis]|jgi:3-hydroxyisobutyrate dehydrogenase|uniref:NAD-binding protein n=1 Tax=Gracilibacillus thailandensis TaxID=563735 RepID=A0A6N7R191_9BACI|nr:NAD(P)-dependent oxidoreductase [Gracilibacillus thailandensis]MRI67392.1 NAD-binding protein [Gracilibacillus thailandensis]